MHPRLVAITGPLKGATIPIGTAEIIVGREPANAVAINDPLVSRRHCSIRSIEGRIRVSDLESLNGTFVNGVPTREKILDHGDRIKVGISQFVFLVEEDKTVTPVPLMDSPEDQFVTTVTVNVQHEEAVYFQPDKIAEALPPSVRVSRDLSVLLKISTAVSGIRKAEDLQAKVLEMIFEVIPVERAAILIIGHNPDEFVSGVYREKGIDVGHSFRISRTVAKQVLRDGVAIMGNDVLASESFRPTESLVASQIRSLLCVPLMVFGAKLGVIYADTTHAGAHIDEHHLHLLTAIASIAAVALEHARYVEWLEGENQRLQDEINIEHDMVGDSPRIRDVLQFVSKVAVSDSTAFIRGESGTGKELVARAIHRNSKRAGRPFVAINCAALTEGLLESELFGHEKGAFTTAMALKKGKIEVADGGTLFLDEIGEMAPQLQAKLLRALQYREFERVGGTRPIKVDIRLIAATNRNIEEAIKSGAFRQDLYYRLNVVSVTLPALRERREDIPLLATYFVQKYSRVANRPVAGISPEAHALLKHFDWPGNVRELENAIERAVVLGSSDHIRPEDLPEALVERKVPSQASELRYHDAVNSVKRQLIIKAVEKAGGNFTEAAKLLDLHPNYLHRLIRNMDIREQLKKMGS